MGGGGGGGLLLKTFYFLCRNIVSVETHDVAKHSLKVLGKSWTTGQKMLIVIGYSINFTPLL